MNSPNSRRNHRLHLLTQSPLRDLESLLCRSLRWRTPEDFESIILTVSTTQRSLVKKDGECAECGRRWCAAWLKIWCGGCKEVKWVCQNNLYGAWCPGCQHAWQRESAEQDLAKFAGLPALQAIQLVENLEQRDNLVIAWELQHELNRLTQQNNTIVLNTACKSKNGIRIPQLWVVAPNDWDRMCRRYAKWKPR